MEWKFKVGDEIEDKHNVYTVTKQDYIQNGYLIFFEDEYFFIGKGLLESECKLIKPKSLFEQALSLVGLEIGDEFIFGEGLYRVETDNITRLQSYNEYLFPRRITIQDLLVSKHKITKTKPKSEAELILDELAKVVDKAEDILRRSGR